MSDLGGSQALKIKTIIMLTHISFKTTTDNLQNIKSIEKKVLHFFYLEN